MYFTAFSAQIIDQPDLQRGQEPEETFTGNKNDQDSVFSDSAESINLTPQQRVVTYLPRTSSLFTQGVSMFQGMARRRSNTARSRGHSEPRLSVNTTDNQTDSRLNRYQRGSVNITDDQTNDQLDSTRSTTPHFNDNISLYAIAQSNSNESNSTALPERNIFEQNDNVTERHRQRRPRDSNPKKLQ